MKERKELLLKYLKFLHDFSKQTLDKTDSTEDDVRQLEKEVILFKEKFALNNTIPDELRKQICSLHINIKRNLWQLFIARLFETWIYSHGLALFRKSSIRDNRIEKNWIKGCITPFRDEVKKLLLLASECKF